MPDFKRLRADGVNAISIYIAWQVPSATSSALAPTRHTPSAETLTTVTSLAHATGLAVEWMPLVLVPGSARLWLSPRDATTWWANYQAMIDQYAVLAHDDNVEIFSIGSELHNLQSDAPHWTALANRVKGLDGYRGLTTYMSAGGLDGHQLVVERRSYRRFAVLQPVDGSDPGGQRIGVRVGAHLLAVPQERLGHLPPPGPDGRDRLRKPARGPPTNLRPPGNDRRRRSRRREAQANAYRALLDVSSAPAQKPWLRGVMWFAWSKVKNPVRDKSYTPRDKTAECTMASS